jgi:hypothetical protein
MFNAHHDLVAFTIPAGLGHEWGTVIGSDPAAEYPESVAPGDELRPEGRSLLVLRRE